jgi:hypothetical protein
MLAPNSDRAGVFAVPDSIFRWEDLADYTTQSKCRRCSSMILDSETMVAMYAANLRLECRPKTTENAFEQ